MVTTADWTMPRPEKSAFGFECTACGKCCNSPPQLTIPELFKHQQRFFGSLALRTVARPQTGSEHTSGGEMFGPGLALDLLAERILHPIPGSRNLYAALSGQAFGFPSQPHCSELLTDGRCGVHDSGKPAVCSVVPLDALEPDRLQSAVLASRLDEAAFNGAECITRELPTSRRVVAHGEHLVSEPLHAALERHRRALKLEKHYWGNRVFAFLSNGSNAVPWLSMPLGNWLELGMTPVLAAIAELSPNCRLRTIEYIHSQILLGERLAHTAETRRSLVDLPAVQRLRAYLQALAHLKRMMLGKPAPFNGDTAMSLEAERWLGV